MPKPCMRVLHPPAAAPANHPLQLHTDLSDLKIELFCESVPKTAEVRASASPPPAHRSLTAAAELPRPLRIRSV